ncbi:Amine sulfotransferase [Altererythrobacter insulae]|nr:Amine sulfotransferase [Altererythrobacter insulae]
MTLGLGRAARTAEEFGINMMAAASVPPEHFRPLESEPGDVFITTWAKSGTTMVQQMFHQIRMIAATGKGDMDFDDISRMTPWEDTGPLIDYDVNGPQRAEPRGFKSHREYERLPADRRYVVTLRDPHETYVSFYRFFDGWHIERGALSLEEYMPLWLSGGPGGCDYFTHLLSWYARRDEADTLLATYRWAVKNKRAMICRLAEFCELELTDEQVSLVEQMTSRDFMHQHLDKFDDKMVAEALEKRVGIPATSDSTKVQASGSDAKQVPAMIRQQIDDMWAERVAPVTGHASFAELAQELDS